MPFTTSHPAIVIPLKRLFPKYFSLTGLMAGAMSPDLLYFLLGFTNNRGFSHSWLGLFVFCLPAGIAFSFAFHWLFKSEAIYHLPKPLDLKLSGLADANFAIFSLNGWLKLTVSVFIGALSHFFWDSFTHKTGEIVQMIPWMLNEITFFGIQRPYTRWLQHASSLIGGIVVLKALFSTNFIPSPTRNMPIYKPSQKILFWSVCALFATAFTFGMVWFYNEQFNWQIEYGHNRSLARITAGLSSWAGAFYMVCVYGLARRFKKY